MLAVDSRASKLRFARFGFRSVEFQFESRYREIAPYPSHRIPFVRIIGPARDCENQIRPITGHHFGDFSSRILACPRESGILSTRQPREASRGNVHATIARTWKRSARSRPPRENPSHRCCIFSEEARCFLSFFFFFFSLPVPFCR